MAKKTDYDELFGLLNSGKVKYLVVGAYAVSHYAEPRYTGDLDLFVPTEPINAGRLVEAIDKFGFAGLGITRNDFLAPDRIIQLGYPPLRVDFITGISAVKFSEAWKSRKRGKLGNSVVWYISRSDLIKNKKRAARPKDKIDLLLLGKRPLQKGNVEKKS